MKDYIVFRDAGLYFNDWVYLGECYREVDGFYVYQPKGTVGVFNEYSLRLIADKLQELNKEWDDYIKATLK